MTPRTRSRRLRLHVERGGAGRTLLGVVALLTTLALVGLGLVVLTQPRIVVGEPLPVARAGYTFLKPDPPRLLLQREPVKPTAVDLVSTPAPISVASTDDPVVQALAGPLANAVSRAGDAGVSGVQVIDADGRIVFDLNGATPLLPASAAKLITAAAALTAFGPDRTYVTTVTSDAPLDAEGTLQGDLVLLGGGDPTLVSQAWVDAKVDEDRPSTLMSDLADQVVASGITAIAGGVVGDGDNLDGPPLAEGWPDRYLEDRDATRITGLTVDEGLELYTTDSGQVRSRAAADPVAQAAQVLHDALVERGVVITAAPRSAAPDELDPLTRRHAVTGVLPSHAAVESPPLQVLLSTMVQRSDNHLADTFFRHVGLLVEGEGTWTDAETQSVRVLRDLNLDFSTARLADGSGLSRENRVPAGLLTALNFRMTNSTVGVAWQDLMAVSGVSGTLRRRLVGTIAELRLRGKTGSLGDVRALTGAVVGPDGRPVFFTVMSNELSGPQLASARRLQDLTVLAISAHLYDCAEIQPPADAEPEPSGVDPLPTHVCSS